MALSKGGPRAELGIATLDGGNEERDLAVAVHAAEAALDLQDVAGTPLQDQGPASPALHATRHLPRPSDQVFARPITSSIPFVVEKVRSHAPERPGRWAVSVCSILSRTDAAAPECSRSSCRARFSSIRFPRLWSSVRTLGSASSAPTPASPSTELPSCCASCPGQRRISKLFPNVACSTFTTALLPPITARIVRSEEFTDPSS